MGLALCLVGGVAGCSASTARAIAGHPDSATHAAPPAAHTVATPLTGRRTAWLAVLSGATSVTVGTGHLGGSLLRASTPRGAGVVPDLVVTGGRVQLYLRSSGTGGPAAVTVTLNSAVAWGLTFSGGSTVTSAFLGHGVLRGADFTAGSSQITMDLPRPRGTIAIVLAGGASQVTLVTPAGVPARLHLDGGASNAMLDGHGYSGISGGTVLATPNWASTTNRYDITAPAGVSQITVRDR